MKHVLKHGQALVVTGPDSCGKTTLARAIAKRHGSLAEIAATQLLNPFHLGNLLARQPATIIVERLPDARDMTEVRGLISATLSTAHRQMRPPVAVRTPNYIFCSGHVDALRFGPHERRFFVLSMPTADVVEWERKATGGR